MARQPASPDRFVHAGVGQLVGDEEDATGLKDAVDASERLPVAVASAAEAKDTTHEDGPVGAAWLDLVGRSDAESGREAAL